MINVTVRPQVYTAHRAILHRSPLLVIDGVLQVEGEVLNAVAKAIHPVAAVIAEDARETRLEARQAAADVPLGRPIAQP